MCRFLATGQSFYSLHNYFLLCVTTLGKIVRGMCQAVWEELHDVMPQPTEEQWEKVAAEF